MEDRKSREESQSLMARVVAVAVMAVGMSVAWQEVEFQMRHEQEATSFRSREAVIRADLYTVRSCIDQHLADKGFYPESLQALVDEGYLRSIPVDPFTGTDEDAWEEIYFESAKSEEPREEYGAGVCDIRYASHLMLGGNGTPIHGW